jgi:hypothetical protein
VKKNVVFQKKPLKSYVSWSGVQSSQKKNGVQYSQNDANTRFLCKKEVRRARGFFLKEKNAGVACDGKSRDWQAEEANEEQLHDTTHRCDRQR